MRKLFVVTIIVALFVSCSKEKDEKTTYEIINNSEFNVSAIEYLDGTLWEVIIFHYIGDDIAKQVNVESIPHSGGTSGKLEIGDNIEKVKVSFKFVPKDSPFYDLPENNRKYVVAYLFIEKGKNNVIKIDDSTLIGSTLKSAVLGEDMILRDILLDMSSSIQQ